LSLLAVTVVSATTAATASAELNGPWWKHRGKVPQEKLPTEMHFGVRIESNEFLKIHFKVLGEPVTVECKVRAESNAIVWNGLHQGQDSAQLVFENCKIPGQTCAVTVASVKVFTELMWKYQKKLDELHTNKGQEIYDSFAPLQTPKNGRALFLTIKIPAGCHPVGEFQVEAAGTEQLIENQGPKQPVVWGTAGRTEPENVCARPLILKWTIPNQTSLHHKETPIEARLLHGGEPVELEGQLRVELTNGEELGAFNE
jgi:hypothetical protein